MKKILIYLSLLLSFWQVQAANFVVTKGDDVIAPWPNPEVGNFRWAITQANATAGPHTITFDASLNNTTITLDYWEELTLSASKVTIDGTGQNITISRLVNAFSSALVLLDGANETIIKGISWENLSEVIGALAIASDDNEIIDCSFINGAGLYIGFLNYTFGGGGVNKANGNKVYYTNSTTGTLDGSLYVIGDNNEISDLNINGDLILGALTNAGNILAKSNSNTIQKVYVRDFTRLVGDENVLITSSFGNLALGEGQGVQVEGANTEIRSSTVHVAEKDPDASENPTAGIYVRPGSDNITIDQVVLTNSLGIVLELPSGIRLGDWGDGITGSSVSNVDATGYFNGILSLNSSGNTIEDSKFYDNENVGVFLASSSNNTTVTRIESYENGPGGIQVDGTSGVVISESKVYDNASNGITFTNSPDGNTVNTSYVYGNVAGHGIWMSNSSKVDVSGNTVGLNATGTVSGNGGNGIFMDAGALSNVIDGNTVVASGNVGIMVSASSQNSILSNFVGNTDNSDLSKENTVSGISVIGGGQGNIIGLVGQGNTIKNKQSSYAISVDGSGTITNRILGNNTSSNKNQAIFLSSNGNNLYGDFSKLASNGAVTFNDGETGTDKISGRAPAVGDIIDVYISIDGTCQSPISGKVPQGATWVGSTVATTHPDGESWAYWSFDLSTVSGLTFDNAVVTATQGTGSTAGNTSAFATCKTDLICVPPTGVAITSTGTEFCGSTTDFTLSATPSSGFTYAWYNGTDLIVGQDAATLVVSESGDYKVVVGDLSVPIVCDVESLPLTITKFDDPTLDGNVTITGLTTVCIGADNVSYLLNDPTNSGNSSIVYNWSLAPNSAGLLGSSNTERFASFTGANVIVGDDAYTLSIEITEEHTEVTCTGNTETLAITVEADPIITFENSPKAVECSSPNNLLVIEDFDDSKYTYEILSSSDVTINSFANGVINFDASDVNGKITVKATSAAGCFSTAEVTVSVVGCSNNVSVNVPFACADETVVFTSNFTEGTAETKISQLWTIDPSDDTNYEVIGGLTSETLTLKLINTSITDIEIKASVAVLYEKFNAPNTQQVTVTNSSSVTVNGLPDVAGGLITGDSPVCENSSHNYTFDQTGYADYKWSVLSGNGTLVSSGLANQDVNFSTANAVDVEIVVAVGEDKNGIVCYSNNSTPIAVVIESTPSVTVDDNAPSIACNSPINAYKIEPFDNLSSYVVVSQPTGMNVTIDANGNINIDAGTATVGGDVIIQQTTAAGCTSSALEVTMVVSLTGCGRSVNFTVDKSVVCSGETVVFTSQIDAAGGTILNYDWSSITNGTVVGATNEESVTVLVSNVTNASVSVSATLQVTFDDAPTSMTKTLSLVTVNPNPVLADVGVINGASEVCFDSEGIYSIGATTDNFNYTWNVTQGLEIVASASNEFGVKFNPILDFTIADSITVSVQDKTTGCFSTDTALIEVTVDELPVVLVDPSLTISCSSTGNEIVITSHDPLNPSTYTAVSSDGFTNITVDNVNGIVSFDAGSVTTSGTISITETTTVSGMCTSLDAADVVITIQGCDISIEESDATCPVAKNVDESITFIAVIGGGVADVTAYRWEIIIKDVVGTVLDNYTTTGVEGTITIPAINDTDDIVTYEAILSVEFNGDNVFVISGDLGSTIVYRRPDHASLDWALVGDALSNNCVGDIQEYVITPTDLTKSYSLTTDQNAFYTSLSEDTIRFENIYQTDSSYLVSASVFEIYSNVTCYSKLDETGDTRLVPELMDIIGSRQACVFDHTLDSVVYRLEDDTLDLLQRNWWVTRPSTNVVSWKSNLSDADTIAVKFGTENDNRDYDINDSVYVRQLYDHAGCIRIDTSFAIVEVDTAYLVHYHIQTLKELYCEGDTGKMFVDLLPYQTNDTLAVYDPWGTFGSKDNHYGEYTWMYNEDVTKEVNETEVVYEIDPTTGDTLSITNYFKSTFDENDEDTLLYNPYIGDKTWSSTFGPFAIEDSIFFIAEPKFCVYSQSVLGDTIILEEILQVKPEILMTIEGDEDVHVIEEVVSIPQIEINDINNFNGDLTYQYAILWIDKNGDNSIEGIEAFAPAVFGKTVATPPSGYDTVTYVMVLETGSCTVYDTTLLVLDFGVFIPSVFTPNADGEYDEWVIQNIELFDGASVQVFNRWGSLLYETTDYVNNQWNGTYDGEVLPVASYYYVVDLKDGSDVISGAVSIIR